METEAAAITLKPEPTNSKEELLLAKIPMPDSANQKEGTRNELEIKVRYIKDGMGRLGGRGFFLTIHGYAVEGLFKTFMLCQDPSEYIFVEPCQRFGAKAMNQAASRACGEEFRAKIEKEVVKAQKYYLGKTFPM